VVAAPAFAIRKPAVAVFTLDDYVAAGIMRAEQAETLRAAVADRQNILVAGGTSTGKTTLTNALLAEVAKTSDRVVLIEDTRELQCKAPNLVALRTKDGVASLSDLVRSSLRLRPDRIPIGEVRGAEALAGLGQLGRNPRQAGMNLGADMMRDKPYNPLAIPRRQTFSGIDEAARQPIDPEPSIGVEHHLDNGSVVEPQRDRWAKRGAQHARAARGSLLIEMVDCHFGPQAWRPLVAAMMSGIIRRMWTCARATRSDRS
jgi:hypothetical protein